MKFQCVVDISAPLHIVVDTYQNPDYFAKWQDGFQRLEHLSGVPGDEGSKSRVTYLQGKRHIVLTETILNNTLPLEFKALYEHKHMDNIMTNEFTETEDGKSRWTATIEYTKFYGVMPKLMAKLFPSMFKNQTQKWLDRFKNLVETEIV